MLDSVHLTRRPPNGRCNKNTPAAYQHICPFSSGYSRPQRSMINDLRRQNTTLSSGAKGHLLSRCAASTVMVASVARYCRSLASISERRPAEPACARRESVFHRWCWWSCREKHRAFAKGERSRIYARHDSQVTPERRKATRVSCRPVNHASGNTLTCWCQQRDLRQIATRDLIKPHRVDADVELQPLGPLLLSRPWSTSLSNYI